MTAAAAAERLAVRRLFYPKWNQTWRRSFVGRRVCVKRLRMLLFFTRAASRNGIDAAGAPITASHWLVPRAHRLRIGCCGLSVSF
ncbi:hypothetical protein F2P81_018930 [Scophthalmus maximus]|uniref:Uncharacterized protein n=1 Tax=Scophthalmus maximus TaxID=52904 RepID=A0A6A4SBL2_SCOMX|nr:hypothetical protein F2P81_018930 [Scophthalmus maximus]